MNLFARKRNEADEIKHLLLCLISDLFFQQWVPLAHITPQHTLCDSLEFFCHYIMVSVSQTKYLDFIFFILCSTKWKPLTQSLVLRIFYTEEHSWKQMRLFCMRISWSRRENKFWKTNFTQQEYQGHQLGENWEAKKGVVEGEAPRNCFFLS